MAGAKDKPQIVSMRDLAVHIDKAVEIAAKQVGVTPDPHTITLRWDLIGRILRDMNLAQDFAAATVTALGTRAGKVHPAVVQIDKRIVAGFVPVELMRDMRSIG